MYGQFHNEQTLTQKRSTFVSRNELTKTDGLGKKLLVFISLLLITISFSSTSFAGPSQPRLPGGNGNSNGR